MLMLPRPPKDRDELHLLIRAMWGVDLPRVAVCDDHVSPFEAVAHAYFGESPNFAVWYASRGSGKSLALATLGLTKAFVRDVDVTILGGSMTQSLNVREHMRKLMAHRNAPSYAVAKDTATLIQMRSGRSIKPLPASQTTVRGPHPPLQLLDEVDEMELSIYEASLGQAMEQINTHGEVIDEYIVASSTWQNPEGTFTEVIDRARTQGMPIMTWCWRELLEPHGWMSKRFIEGKRKTVSAQMWKTEYELNEPSGASRAFDLDRLDEFFVDYPEPIRTTIKGDDEQSWVWQEPEVGMYAVGADWAKEQDMTIIAVVRYDVKPYRLVKLTRVHRKPWPTMIAMFNRDVEAYRAVGEHDRTGLGNVINDYIDFPDTVNGFTMVGRPRTQLLLDYIAAFEHGDYRLPQAVPGEGNDYLARMKRAHRGTTVADVYAPGKWDTHLPDEVAAMALAHRAITKSPAPATVPLLGKSEEPRTVDKPFHAKPYGETRSEGLVSVVEERYDDVGVFWLPGGG